VYLEETKYTSIVCTVRSAKNANFEYALYKVVDKRVYKSDVCLTTPGDVHRTAMSRLRADVAKDQSESAVLARL